jgi:sodium/potassium/calcium exchanger 6
MSSDGETYPPPPEGVDLTYPPPSEAFPPPAAYAPPDLDYALGCRPFASANLHAACTHARNNPLCLHGDIDYLSFYYCDGSEEGADPSAFALPSWTKLPLLLAWTALMFASLGAVAERFFAPAVEKIAKRLRLSEDIAGATLLAFGGAAPDIFTQVAAIIESGIPDASLALSESIGAGLFVAFIGKALIVLIGVRDGKTHRVEVDLFPYARDVWAYGGLIIVTIFCVSDGEVSTFEAFVFVFWYVAYVWVVLKGEDLYRRARGLRPRTADAGGGVGGVGGVVGPGRDAVSSRRNAGRDGVEMVEHRVALGSGKHATGTNTRTGDVGVLKQHVARSRDARDDATDEDEEEEEEARGSKTDPRERLVRLNAEFSADGIVAASAARARRGRGPGGSTFPRRGNDRFASLRAWAVAHGGLAGRAGLAGRYDDEDDDANDDADDDADDDANDFLSAPERERIFQALERPSMAAYATAPLLLLMSLTMVSAVPPGRAPREHVAIVCAFAPLFAMRVTGMWSRLESAFGNWGVLSFALAWTVCVFFLARAKAPRRGVNPRKSPSLQLSAFFIGIAWMHACADEVVGIFQAAGRIAGVRESLLGATVMAWGASAGDLAGMLATARAGYVKTALTAALAGPVCQLAMGSGFSMAIVKSFGNVRIPSELAPNTLFLFWFGAAFILGYYGVVVPTVHGREFGKTGAFCIAGVYAAAILVFVSWGISRGGEE